MVGQGADGIGGSADEAARGMSGVMLQAFHWYQPGGGTLWREIAARAQELADTGFTAVWLPPASKGHVGGYDVGYGVYDLFDLGEFDQKGTVRTKYGTREEYLAAIRALQRAGLAAFADVVWNHRLGADAAEVLRATPFAADNRRHAIGPMREVEVWTRFDFTGRGGAYDSRTLDARHFTAVDFDGRAPEQRNAIFLFEGKRFDDAVDEEFGNYHYLMGCDLDHSHPDVRAMTLDWGRWFLDTTGVDGLRLDAVKHLPTWAVRDYLEQLRSHVGRPLPVVAEYWSQHLAALEHFLTATGAGLSDAGLSGAGLSGVGLSLFDVPLHFTFHLAGRAGSSFDLRTVFDGSLVASRPGQAVTFVDNHDSQPLQALESPVDDWFKPLAYAVILLRREGLPCVFVADYDGATYTDQRWGEPPTTVRMTSFRPFLDVCLRLRAELGPDARQSDFFDHPNVIGWVRRGAGLTVVVLMSNGDVGSTRIRIHVPDTEFRDATGTWPDPIRTDRMGTAEFRCPAGGVSLWVARGAG